MVRARVDLQGTSYGAPCELENVLAKIVIDRVPCLEMVRFVSSGTEACLSVLRLMRAYTKRDKVSVSDSRLPAHAACASTTAQSCLLCLALLITPLDQCSPGSAALHPAHFAAVVGILSSQAFSGASQQTWGVRAGPEVRGLLPRPRRQLPGAGRLRCRHIGPARLPRRPRLLHRWLFRSECVIRASNLRNRPMSGPRNP